MVRLAAVFEILVGALVIAHCAVRITRVRDLVALTVSPERPWLLRYLGYHRRLMAVFVAGYLATAVLFIQGSDDPDALLVATIFLLGAVFVRFGLGIQLRMSTAMQRTIAGLVPVCAWCKQVRIGEQAADGSETWITMEEHLTRERGGQITHGICPACEVKLKAETKKGRWGPGLLRGHAPRAGGGSSARP